VNGWRQRCWCPVTSFIKMKLLGYWRMMSLLVNFVLCFQFFSIWKRTWLANFKMSRIFRNCASEYEKANSDPMAIFMETSIANKCYKFQPFIIFWVISN
jgi:hypothetical protein